MVDPQHPKNRSLAIKLTALAGAAGLAAGAKAAIVESPTIPASMVVRYPVAYSITITGAWDIDGSGSADFLFAVSGKGNSDGYVVTNHHSTGKMFGNNGVRLIVDQNNNLANLSANFAVGPTLAAGFQFAQGVTMTRNEANVQPAFTYNVPGRFGFKFTDGGSNTYYGWGTLVIPLGQTTPFRITDAYYQNIPGQSISASATPEPGAMALLALGATGLAAWRLRRKSALAQE